MMGGFDGALAGATDTGDGPTGLRGRVFSRRLQRLMLAAAQSGPTVPERHVKQERRLQDSDIS